MLPTFDIRQLQGPCRSPTESPVDTYERTMVGPSTNEGAVFLPYLEQKVLLLVASKMNVACLICRFGRGRYAAVPADKSLSG